MVKFPQFEDGHALELLKIAVLKALGEAWGNRPCVVHVDLSTGEITTDTEPARVGL